MKNSLVENTCKSFRVYLDEVYMARNKYKGLIPLSVGYPIGNILKLSREVLKELSVQQNGEEIERLGYGWNFNTTVLKEGIASYESTKNKASYTSNNVALTAGGTHAVNKVAEYLLPRNDSEIIVASPVFYKLFGLIQKHSTVIPVEGSPEENFIPSEKSIFKSVNARTKIIFISNPSNPVYKFYPSNDLEEIIAFAESKNIYVLLDEVGDAFRYIKNYKYPSNITSSNVIRVNSASKSLLMAEYSLGYILANPKISSAVSKLVNDEMGHIPFAGCPGWLKSLELEEKRLKKENTTDYETAYKYNLKYLETNRDCVIKMLNKSNKVTNIIDPDGCFSLVFSVKSNKYSDDLSFFKKLLSSTKVSLVPGSGFGIKSSELYFRLTFAIDKEILKDGIYRILDFIENN
jgi:aspartate/methionine/tyrosine aminotransferase